MDNLSRLDNSDAFLINTKNSVDERGSFCKVFQESWFKKRITFSPKECYFSVSKKNVIRGFHLQINNSLHGKIVSCISGKVIDVLVDLRKGEKFGNVVSTLLDGSRNDTLFIPKGYGHSFLNIHNYEATLLYLVETEYSPANDSGVLWSSVAFDWPIKNPIVSERDQSLVDIKNFKPIVI